MDPSSKNNKDVPGEKGFSIQPIKESLDDKAGPFKAHPGPAMTKDMPQEEGNKDDRKARKEELNK